MGRAGTLDTKAVSAKYQPPRDYSTKESSFARGFPMNGKKRNNAKMGASTVMGRKFADKVLPKKHETQ